MTLKECYDALGGNYEDTVRRLYNEKLVEKFLFKPKLFTEQYLKR